MNAIAKFGLIEAGLFLCVLSAFIRGLERLSGKVLLLAASVLVGVLLAVYGQVYQTGADAYENFVLWTILILPWVIVGRSHALCFLWLVVTNVAMLTFWFQVEPPRGFDFELGIFLILGIWNGIALAVREYSDRAGLAWIGGIWSRRLIWFAVLTYLSIPTIVLIDELEVGDGAFAGAVGLVVALVAGHWYFQFRQPDLLCLGLNVLATCIILMTFIGRLLLDVGDDAGVFLLFGLIVLAMFSGAAFYLRMLSRRLGGVGN